jgi:hypothetical protein
MIILVQKPNLYYNPNKVVLVKMILKNMKLLIQFLQLDLNPNN